MAAIDDLTELVERAAAVEQADLIVSCGDLTWGPLPEETYELARGLNARFVRGNADRAVLEGVSETEREQSLGGRESALHGHRRAATASRPPGRWNCPTPAP